MVAAVVLACVATVLIASGLKLPEVFEPAFSSIGSNNPRPSSQSSPRSLEEYRKFVAESSGTPIPASRRDSTTGVIGNHHLGHGYVIALTLQGEASYRVTCLFDPVWRQSETNRGPQQPYRFAGKPERVGETIFVDTSLGRHGRDAARFFHRGEVIEVHVGTPGSDGFSRGTDATRALFVCNGGSDWLVSPPEATSDSTSLAIDERGRPIALPFRQTETTNALGSDGGTG